MSKATVVVCGPFVPDPEVPPNHVGVGACLNCHLMGRPGDPHHPLPDVTAQAEHRHRYGDE